MAEEMEEENWIKTAVPDRDTKSIYVTVTEGYIYQVFYDEETGELVIYPIGPDDGHSITKLKVSYDKVNAIINMKQPQYARYETGRRDIPLDTLIILSNLYNTSVDYILDLTDEKRPYQRK